MARRPRIVVTLDTGTTFRRDVPFPEVHAKAAYAAAVERAGGIPLLAAPTEREATVEGLCAVADGLVVTGGDFDLDPASYGVSPPDGVRVDPPKPLRTSFEQRLVRHALDADLPLLGICGGMQLLAVLLGATLHLDLRAAVTGALEHEQPHSPAEPGHPVQPVAGGALAALVGDQPIGVNSTHHQAIATLPPSLRAEAHAPDGVLEAVAHRTHPFAVGVQWHPELLADRVSDAIYGALVTHAMDRT